MSPVEAQQWLIAIPFIGLLFACFFRLDQIMARPKKISNIGHALSDWDENGQPLCVEPDGRVFRHKRLELPGGAARLRRPAKPRVFWVIEGD